MMKGYICAVDIGSAKISACVAGIKQRRITEIFVERMPSKGLRRGSVVDATSLIACVEKILKKLKTKSGIPIKSVYLNISGEDIVTKHSKAILPLAERGNKVITLSDIQKVREQARILGSSLEEEIIHQIPFKYAIDAKSNILQPLGLYSHKLEVDLYLICAKIASFQNLMRVINQSGYDVKKIFFSGIATSRAVFTLQSLKDGINLLCDIGNDITELVLFNEGLLEGVEIIQTGGSKLNEELAKSLDIPLELAEEVKKSCAIPADINSIDEEKEILIKKDNIYKPIKQKVVAEMLKAKAKEISQEIKAKVETYIPVTHIKRFVVTGNTVLLDGLLELLEEALGIRVELGRINNQEIAHLLNQEVAASGQKSLDYLTCLGMLAAVMNGEESLVVPASKPSGNFFVNTLERAKEVYQEYF